MNAVLNDLLLAISISVEEALVILIIVVAVVVLLGAVRR